MSHAQLWKRQDVEHRMGEVFDCAKNGETQYIKDSDGEFEVRFVKSSRENESIGAFLSRGGPVDDDDDCASSESLGRLGNRHLRVYRDD